jgi:PBP1b-binding outer membrane lipoprotein LpoB
MKKKIIAFISLATLFLSGCNSEPYGMFDRNKEYPEIRSGYLKTPKKVQVISQKVKFEVDEDILLDEEISEIESKNQKDLSFPPVEMSQIAIIKNKQKHKKNKS